MKSFVKEFSEALDNNDREKLFGMIKHNPYNTRLFHKEFKKYRDSKRYFYLVTFTLNEKYHKLYNKNISEERAVEIESYICSQFQREPLQVQQAHIVREKTKKGLYHWHVSVETSKYLAKNRFNYYIKTIGFVDISKSKCQTIHESLNYINKSGTSKQIV